MSDICIYTTHLIEIILVAFFGNVYFFFNFHAPFSSSSDISKNLSTSGSKGGEEK